MAAANESTPPAASVCRTCGQEPAGDDGIGAKCRARRMAGLAAMAAAQKTADELAAAKAAKGKKPSRAKAEADAAGKRLAGDLERLLGPKPETLPAGELVAEVDAHDPQPVPPVRVRVRVSSSGLAPPKAQTCCQCPREKPFPADPDNTVSRCGPCVRKNKAAMRDFWGRG